MGVGVGQVAATAALLEEGATVPFIARYRREVTGLLDEVAIAAIRDRVEALRNLDSRRSAIKRSLNERDLMSSEIEVQIDQAETISALEDVYLPHRPKRRTRATIARERGLEALALLMLDPDVDPQLDPVAAARPFVVPEKGVESIEEALCGARDIVAETFAENASARKAMRHLFVTRGIITSKVARNQETAGANYQDYFDWHGPVATVPSHRILAILRGENEKVLKVKLEPAEDAALPELHSLLVRRGLGAPLARQLNLAVEDGYKRLLAPSMATETWTGLKARADREAISVFAENVRDLLLAPPLGQKRVLALDPGFRTGCKLVCLDRQGNLVHHDTIYPHTGTTGAETAGNVVRELCERFAVEAIAIGNGTAGRETERFVRDLDLPGTIAVVMVNESGASIYSASDVAREEFPDHDVTVRGAVSIGRRLMDPLAELIKVDPKSIGVGQYQHDVDQIELRRSLEDTVTNSVNAVGVDLNTASKQLLSHVSGLGPQLARNIVSYRDTSGPFSSRGELKRVPRLGPKAFEQAAGFLRIRGGREPLDASGVHPESYKTVAAMASEVGSSPDDLMRDPGLREQIDLSRYVGGQVGLPTLRDIMAELSTPGRDPRKQFEVVRFAEGINEIKDVEPGMTLDGVVTNVTAFGAFVDIGVHQDGLVHISEMADRFVRNPAEMVSVQQKVTVRVLDLDLERKRISLSMKEGSRRA